MEQDSLNGFVGLFFVVDGELLLHKCTLSDGEQGADFVNYPESHDTVWQREYYSKYGVDFDYYPRGRIVFKRSTETYLLYYDACAASEMKKLYKRFTKCVSALDEHYSCNNCNEHYVNLI